MNNREVIGKLSSVVGTVANHLENQDPDIRLHYGNLNVENTHTDMWIINWIENAVNEQIKREKHHES